MGALRTLVVDDHELYRRGLVGLLEPDPSITIVGEASRGGEAIQLALELCADVVLMDLNMPGMSGVEATMRLRRASPARVVVLTAFQDDARVLGAILAGASGYLLKDAAPSQIVKAIKQAATGGSLLSPQVASRLLEHIREPRPLLTAPLTPREHDVLELMVEGLENREIGRALYMSQHTVKNHVTAVLRKMEVTNRVQAAVKAVRAGIN